MRGPWILLPIIPLALACRDAPPTATLASLSNAGPLSVPQRVDLGTLGGLSSFGNDINENSTVVGSADNAAGERRAFRWTAQDGMTDLGTLPGDDWSTACCILNSGRILGVSGVNGARGRPVIWSSDGTITAIEIPLLPGAIFGTPNDFNERGDVVGWDVFAWQHAWIWSEAQGKYDITANVPGRSFEGAPVEVNGDGLVLGTNNSRTAGCYRVTSCWRPFLWSYETGYRELGTPYADSTAVASAFGLGEGPTVVGTASTWSTRGRPFRWREGEGFTILPTVAGGYATDVNARGTAVGTAWDPVLRAFHATAWPPSGGEIRLSPDDPNPQVAVAVNNAGLIVGNSSLTGGGTHATLWLLGPAPQVLTVAALGDANLPYAVGADAALNACLSDADAPLSRAALVACVTGTATGP